MVPYFDSIKFLNKKISVFEFWGTMGVIFSAICMVSYAYLAGLTVSITFILLLLSIATFYVSNWLSIQLTGKLELVFYHLALYVLIVHFSFLKLLNLPLLSYLDISVLGISVHLILGRIGCFLSGCCHGKPYSKGVSYQIFHLKTGFPRKYFGIKVLPVQLIEGALVGMGIVIFTAWRFYTGIPGSIFQAMLMWYFLLRFFLEFFRGDTSRGYFLALTYCQWLSVLFGSLLLGFSQPVDPWVYYFMLSANLLVVTVALLTVSLYFMTNKDLEKFYPDHLMELSETFRHFKADKLYITSKGLGISFKVIPLENHRKIILTFSNFHSSPFTQLLSDRLAGILYHQLGENVQSLCSRKNIFQYINK